MGANAFQGDVKMRSLYRCKVFILAFLFLLKLIRPVWTMMPVLSPSSRLKAGDTLVSPSGVFEYGIFQFPGKYQLCIRYAYPIEQVVTWVANRDIPLSASSYVELSSPDGNLQLFDPANNPTSPSWSSNTANMGVGKAQLLDTGNLVLLDINGKQIYWDSFNNGSVTDTLLPGQYLAKTDNRNLTSWLSKDNPSTVPSPTSGHYTFGWGMRANKSILQLAWASPKTFMNWTGGIYIPAPDVHDPRTISNVEYMYFHPTEGHLYVKSSPADTAILRGGEPVSKTTLKRLTMDTDGGLRIWQWNTMDSGQKTWIAKANWVVSERTESRSQCTAFASCGQFGWCVSPIDSLDRVQCKCPEGFKPLDDTDPTMGCTPVVPLSTPDCSDAKKVKLLQLNDTDMPWSGGYKNLTGADSGSCKDVCLTECKCAGAVYSKDEIFCRTKSSPLYNLGYPTKALHGTDRTAYVKISIYQPAPQPESNRTKWIKQPKYIVIIVVGGTAFLSCIIGTCMLKLFCRFRGLASAEPDFRFPGAEFSATQSFSPPRGTLEVERSSEGDLRPNGVNIPSPARAA